jgi:hypothetical protein
MKRAMVSGFRWTMAACAVALLVLAFAIDRAVPLVFGAAVPIAYAIVGEDVLSTPYSKGPLWDGSGKDPTEGAYAWAELSLLSWGCRRDVCGRHCHCFLGCAGGTAFR